MFCTLTAVTENQLFLHYGASDMDKYKCKHCKIYTWILDLSSMSWKRYSTPPEDKYGPRRYHTCTRGINNSVMITGGKYVKYVNDQNEEPEPWEDIHMTLGAKTLQQLAIQTIWKHECTLPWQESLPEKLRSLFGFLGDFSNMVTL